LTLALAGKIGVEGIFYGSVGFIAAVSVFWGWWRSQLGWSIIAKALALAVAVFPAMLMYWSGFHAPHWLLWVAVYALWAIPPILAWRAIVIWQAQRKARNIL